jgi:hypothetical protein
MNAPDRLDAWARALKQLPDLLTRTVGEVAQANNYVLEDANAAQLEAGLDADGRQITPEYAELTVDIKTAKGQPTSRVTLRDSGAFYAGIVAQVRGQELEMTGTDPKTRELQEKYGDDIIGLSEEAVAEFREDYVRPELEAKTREILGL